MVSIGAHIDYATQRFRRGRSELLQRFIDGLGDVVLSQSTPTMARFEGAKVVHLLQSPGRSKLTDCRTIPCPLHNDLTAVLSGMAPTPMMRGLKHAVGALSDSVSWVRADGGPYANADFERCNAQAILAGPGGLEERQDLLITLTLMAPYTRFPDRHTAHPCVFLALSDGEFLSPAGDWSLVETGMPFYHPAARVFAMRCTSRPMLTVSLQRLQP